jgi:heptosyltransferase-2
LPRKKIHYLFKSPLKRLIINSIDNLGYLFFPASNIKQKAFDDLKNILIIRLDHIGDFILTLPAIYHLKDMKPDIEISILCDSSLRTVAQATNLFKNVHISSNHWFKRSGNFLLKIKAFFALRNELLKFKYDAGVDFRGDFRNILLLSMSQIKIRLAYPNTGGGFLLQNTNQIIEDQHQIKTNLDLLGLFSIPKAESIVLPTIKPNSKCPETII